MARRESPEGSDNVFNRHDYSDAVKTTPEIKGVGLANRRTEEEMAALEIADFPERDPNQIRKEHGLPPLGGEGDAAQG